MKILKLLFLLWFVAIGNLTSIIYASDLEDALKLEHSIEKKNSLTESNFLEQLEEKAPSTFNKLLQKSKLATITLLQPIILKKRTEIYSNYNNFSEIKKDIVILEEMQKNLFNFISAFKVIPIDQMYCTITWYKNQLDGKNIFSEEIFNKIIINTQSFIKDETIKQQALNDLNTLKSQVNKILIKAEVKPLEIFFESLINLNRVIKLCYLENSYGASDKARSCNNCEYTWTTFSKVGGDRVIRCLFCGYENILSEDKELTLKKESNPYQSKIESLKEALDKGRIDAVMTLVDLYKTVGSELKKYFSEEDIQGIHDKAGKILVNYRSLFSGSKLQERKIDLPSNEEFYRVLDTVLQ